MRDVVEVLSRAEPRSTLNLAAESPGLPAMEREIPDHLSWRKPDERVDAEMLAGGPSTSAWGGPGSLV